MKHEWRKHEKHFYLPKNQPERITLPEFAFFSIAGKGNPNDEFFGEYIGVLYSLSYAVRMSHKQGIAPPGYFEYTVYPLEGVWDISDEAKASGIEKFNKDDLVFNIMIRQPSFVDEGFATQIIERLKESKPHPLLEKVKFESMEEGDCIQMMHMGPYDDEPASFRQMEDYAESMGLERKSKTHREIYITDARKTEPEKLKTVLRFRL